MLKTIPEALQFPKSEHNLTKSLDEAIVTLKELRNKYDDEYDDLKITIDGEAEYYNGDCEVWVNLLGKRLETNEEFNKRIDLEYKRYQRQWDNDRRSYEYLKKKFEG